MRRVCALSLLLVAATLLAGCSDADCPICAGNDPILLLSKHKIDFGATSTSAAFTISNRGTGSLPWELEIVYRPYFSKQSVAVESQWLTLSTLSGSGDVTVTCTADRGRLDYLGISRAVIYIDAPTAANSTRDSVEVFILNSGEWLITDDGTFESCWQVDALDYYWVKGFFLPPMQSAILIDSIALNFCQGDTIIQLLAFDSEFNEDLGVYVPGDFLNISPFFYYVTTGWNVIPVDWYFTFEPYYVGYFQPGSTRPDLRIDVVDIPDTLCWRARDISTAPGEVDLVWQWRPDFETFAIRAFATPILPYNPKMARNHSPEEMMNSLRTGFAHKGRFPVNPKPSLPR